MPDRWARDLHALNACCEGAWPRVPTAVRGGRTPEARDSVGAMVRRTALVIALLALAGCPDEPPDRFDCHIDEQCVEDGVQGWCEMSNDCSFEDESCASGRRYAQLSKEEGACVETNVSTSLAVNGGFENGSAGWTDESSRLEISDDAHTLDASVKVCRTVPDDATYAMSDEPSIFGEGAPMDEHFRARAWIKAAPSEAAPMVGIQFRPTDDEEPYPEIVQTDPPIAPDDDWRLIEVEYTVPEPLVLLEVLVEASQEPGTEGCFLVDDVAVFRLP